ncbi:flavin reductase family protein [Hyphococcus luteus]|uniref:Flavin reductase n=1 Tax=Hyphococcus luteus TaxID=2058213 RepID=A0A2S7K0R0_9PROT|nr:flavin reductase family protein [Marinicaulis flavus]PQA86041.1 flavin reductase [Marinicaulis flavus]
MTDKYRPLKNAFGRFATGIAVAACRDGEGAIAALTVNSFTSVSLEPPLVLWCLENRASSYSAFMAADSYAVSILHAGQKAASQRFAHFLPDGPKEDEFENWVTGAPVLKDRLAGFDCKVAARHEAGDHVILVGEVAKFDSAEGAPLIYYASNYIPGTEKP